MMRPLSYDNKALRACTAPCTETRVCCAACNCSIAAVVISLKLPAVVLGGGAAGVATVVDYV
eukprot:499014-Amphidinium_carterae.1